MPFTQVGVDYDRHVYNYVVVGLERTTLDTKKHIQRQASVETTAPARADGRH